MFSVLTVDRVPKSAWLAGAGTVVLALLWNRRARSTGLPGPPTSFYIGSVPAFLKNFQRMPDWVLEETKKHNGATWEIVCPRFDFVASRFVVMTKPALVQHVLKDQFAKYEKGREFSQIFKEFLGIGIFVSDGAQWKFHRKVASHMFSRNLMKEGAKIAQRQSNVLLARLEASAKANETVDLQDLFFCLTMDVFSEIAFGAQLNSILSPEKHPFAVAFDDVQNISANRFENFFWKVQKVFHPLFAEESRLRSSVRTMRDFSDTVIEARRRDAEGGSAMGPGAGNHRLSNGSLITAL